jgi:hypothetical protein
MSIKARLHEKVVRLIRSRKLKEDRQQSGQEKKDKRTNNDLQNITQKTKDQATRTPLKIGEGVERKGAQVLLIKDTKNMNYMSYPGTRRVNLVTNPVISRE